MRIFIFLAALVLSGCAMFPKKGDDLACPRTGFVADADVAYFKEEAVKAAINGFQGACSFKKAGEVQVELSLPLSAQKDVATVPQPQQITVPYFVAVLSPEDGILQRQGFSAKIAFDKKTGQGGTTEEHVIRIPVDQAGDAYKYKVVIGFSLTPEQLKHNKERK